MTAAVSFPSSVLCSWVRAQSPVLRVGICAPRFTAAWSGILCRVMDVLRHSAPLRLHASAWPMIRCTITHAIRAYTARSWPVVGDDDAVLFFPEGRREMLVGWETRHSYLPWTWHMYLIVGTGNLKNIYLISCFWGGSNDCLGGPNFQKKPILSMQRHRRNVLTVNRLEGAK